MQVFVDDDPLTLDKRMVLGSGGEGTVYKVKIGGNVEALKIYETPTTGRSQKLKAYQKLSPKFPDRVIAPHLMALDGRGMLVGFTMPLLSGSFEEIASLSNKKYRTSFGITNKDVVQIFLDGIPTLKNVHNQGFVVGDLNDLNELFQVNRMLWIDVDSWQFGGFPCPVATENYLDPALFGLDLSARPVFSQGNDWYSYAVMLFKSLMLVHPFGGTHKTLNRVLYRAQKKITVFDKSVTYPKIAYSPDVLTDDMLGAFDKYFTKNFRGTFPEKILGDYLSILVPCKSCGMYFPSTKGTCPVCSAKVLIVVQRPISSSKNFEVIELLKVTGKIITVRVIGDEIRALVSNGGRVVLYTKLLNREATFKVMLQHVPGSKFEMTSEHLFLGQPGNNEVMVYVVSSGKLVGKVGTEIFVPNRSLAFRASDEHFFRVEDGNLKFGEIKNGRLEEKILRRVMEDQTWFWVDPHAETPSVFGFFQVIRQQMYWMVRENKFFDIDICQLEKGENVIDLSAKVSSGGVYLIRKTQVSGKNYIRQELIDSNGKVTYSNKIDEGTHPNPVLHGQAYTFGMVLHPTDGGIMQEKVATGETKVFTDSKHYVDGGDSLLRFGNSLLAVKEDRVLQITMK